MSGVTDRAAVRLSGWQRAMLRFVAAYIEANEWAPSIREIQAGCGISATSAVDYNLKELERKGLIRRGGDRMSRALALTPAGKAEVAP